MSTSCLNVNAASCDLSFFLFIWMISNIVVDIVIFTCLLMTQMFLLVVKQYLMLPIKQIIVCDLNSWFLCNRLSLNLDKTNFTVFGAGKSHINLELTIDGIVIKQVNTCKYLGIMIDDKLSCQDQIDFVHNKVVRFVSNFYLIRHRLSCELSKMMYFAFMYSHLCYGIEIYDNTYHTYLNKLIIYLTFNII